MSVKTFFAQIEAGAVALLKEGEQEVEKLFSEVEPALLSFVKTVDHDFVAAWMPQALELVTNALASGTAMTTSTISSLALELEQSALATGKQVLTGDALTTVQAAAAHIQAAAANAGASVAPPKAAS